MIEKIVNVIIIITSVILAVNIIFNLIESRNKREKEKAQNARMQLVVLLIIYVVYGFLRNLI